jgi:hypothetical protein
VRYLQLLTRLLVPGSIFGELLVSRDKAVIALFQYRCLHLQYGVQYGIPCKRFQLGLLSTA